MNQNLIFQGGTTPQDYKHINVDKLNAFLEWRKELHREWNKMTNRLSFDQQLAWSEKHAKTNQKRSNVDNELRKQVVERDNFTCRYCGKNLKDGKRIHIDHVHPFSKGGETVIENLVTACADCNKAKGYLHGIYPLSLDTTLLLVSENKTNDRKITERRKQLTREWEDLAKDRRQHNLEAENFFYRFDSCNAVDMNTLSELAQRHNQSPIEKVYDLDCWIAGYILALRF